MHTETLGIHTHAPTSIYLKTEFTYFRQNLGKSLARYLGYKHNQAKQKEGKYHYLRGSMVLFSSHQRKSPNQHSTPSAKLKPF